MKNKYFYIYNYEQASFMVKEGLPVIDVGKGNKNDIYIKFLRDNDAENIFKKWRLRKEKI